MYSPQWETAGLKHLILCIWGDLARQRLWTSHAEVFSLFFISLFLAIVQYLALLLNKKICHVSFLKDRNLFLFQKKFPPTKEMGPVRHQGVTGPATWADSGRHTTR